MKRLFLALVASALVGFGGAPRPPRDVHVFRAMWIEYYGCPGWWVDHCISLGWHDDDISVALFLSHHAHVDIHTVIQWRVHGCTWWDVAVRLRLQPAAVFTDADVHNVVHLKVTSEYYGVEAVEVMRQREGGRAFRDIVVERQSRGPPAGRNVRGEALRGGGKGGRAESAPPRTNKKGPKGKGERPDAKGPGPGKGGPKGKSKRTP
jgi:hypothetical protein